MVRNNAASASHMLPARPAAAAQQVPADGSQDIPWCFPCKWTGPDGMVVECGSKDKKKSQHVVSAAHLKFIAEVTSLRQAQAHLVLMPADAENGDPIDLLRWQNDDLVHESDCSSDSDSDVTSVFEVTPKATAASPIGCDGSRSRTPTRVHFASPNPGETALLAPSFSTRSRSHSRTPTRVHFADDLSSAKRQRLK